jgi:uncharacterized protein with FMN-binding domain
MATSTSTSTSSSSSSTTTSSTTTTTFPPVEICDNCLDDDGNGSIDLEDEACCSPATTASLELKKGSLRPSGEGAAKVTLKATLSRTGLPDSATSSQDASIQIRSVDGEVLCARIPAIALVRKKTRLKFRDKAGNVVSADGLTTVTISAQKDGSGRFSAGGKAVNLTLPEAGDLTTTLGLRDPEAAEEGNRCARGTATFRATKKGLSFP